MNTKIQVYLLLSIGLIIFSCKKENQTIKNDSLDFSVEFTNGRNFHLSWTKTNLSNFKNYIIVISQDSIPRNSLPNTAFPVFPFVEGIDDQEIDFFDKSFIPFAEKLYFQLFVHHGNQFFVSEQIKIEMASRQKIGIFPSKILHDSRNKSIIIYDDFKDRLTQYNYQSESVGAMLDVGLKTSGGVVGEYNGNSELYLIDEANTLIILDAVTFELKGSVPMAMGVFGIYSISTNDKGMIAMSVRNASMPVQFFDRENLELLNSVDFNGYFQARGISFISKNENKGIEISNLGIDYFQVDDNGQVIDNQSLNTSLSGFDFDKIVASPNGNYFISTNEGLIYDKNLNHVGELLGNPTSGYADYVFSEDETTLYAIGNDIPSEFLITKYSFPSLDILEINYLPFEPIKLFLENGAIYIVGKEVQTEQTVIQRLET